MEIHTLLSYGGLTIVGLVILQLIGTVTRSIQDQIFAFRRFKSSQQLLSSKIQSAKRSLIFPDKQASAWSGLRKFRVKWKVTECDDCHSFYLVPHDGKPLPPYRPGQFLTLTAKVPGQSRPTVRCYSLSDAPRQDYYRITVKKQGDLQTGSLSCFLSDEIQEGDIVDVKAPAGAFHLDIETDRPVVLIAAGIGVTPLLSMLTYIVKSQPHREIYFFMAARNSKLHPFKTQLETLAQKNRLVHILTSYSTPLAEDQQGQDFDHAGRLHIGHVRDVLPASNFDYYLCGPSSFMASMSEGLRNWGVPEESIRSEAFGPASIKSNKAVAQLKTGESSPVVFSRSNKTINWKGDDESLLEMAERNGVQIESGCRAGNCGTCVTAIKSGRFTHTTAPGCDVEAGSCLTCIAVPDGEIELEA